MPERAETSSSTRSSGYGVLPWIIAAALMLLPFAAMRYTDDVSWDKTDVTVMAVLLFGACGLFELAARASASATYRLAVAVAVAGAFLLVWINLAVGIIGSEDNPANLMYFGLLAIGVVGAALVRFRPYGTGLVMFVIAVGQLLIAITTVAAGLGATGENWPHVIIVLNSFFAALWVIAGLLFRKAGQ